MDIEITSLYTLKSSTHLPATSLPSLSDPIATPIPNDTIGKITLEANAIQLS